MEESLKAITIIFLTLVLSSCGVKKAVNKLSNSLNQKNTDEITVKEDIDSNGDGILDSEAIKLKIDPNLAILPEFTISSISSAILSVYSGENKYEINLLPVGQKTSVRSRLLTEINEDLKSLAPFKNNFEFDLLSFGTISSDEYIKLKYNFLDKYKSIDRASVSFTLELYNGKSPLIEKTTLNSIDVVFSTKNYKLIQNKKFDWDGEVVTWKGSESKWGRIEGDINNISLLNKIISSNFLVSVKAQDVKYNIPPKQYNIESQKESITQKSSEIIYSSKETTTRYFISPGKTLEDICELIKKDCSTNPVFGYELGKKIWEMLPREDFTILPDDLRNNAKSVAGKRYVIVSTNQEEVLSAKKEEKKVISSEKIFNLEAINENEFIYLRMKNLKLRDAKETYSSKKSSYSNLPPSCTMLLPAGGSGCRGQTHSCEYLVSDIAEVVTDLSVTPSLIDQDIFKGLVGADRLFSKLEIVGDYFKLTPNSKNGTISASVRFGDLELENSKNLRQGIVSSSCPDINPSFQNVFRTSKITSEFELYKNGIRNE